MEQNEKNIYRNFILSSGAVIALVVTGIFVLMAVRTHRLMNEQNLIQARALFNTLVLARKWNAGYNGVYVEKRSGVESNPYLRNTDITTTDGRTYVLRNPALMTREIAGYAEREGMFTFHVTSLRPLNVANEPDPFEADALRMFETGVSKEQHQTVQINGRETFRYMAPLLTESSCLSCHRHQGYAVGDVRGGISIAFDIEDIRRKADRDIFRTLGIGAATTVILLGLIGFFMQRLARGLDDARAKIEIIAITDELTGLHNRRYVMSRFADEMEKIGRVGGQLGCILADIDDFKGINDSRGHLVGDHVLKEVARRMRSSVRSYDIVGRYGGEEFLFVLPGTGIEETQSLAERVRSRVGDAPIEGMRVTLSLGAVAREEGDTAVDTLIKRADDRLYAAKNDGRNRVR